MARWRWVRLRSNDSRSYLRNRYEPSRKCSRASRDAPPVQARTLAVGQLEPDLRGDTTRHVVLHEQGIIELPVEARRPDLRIRRSIDQLHDDANAIAV